MSFLDEEIAQLKEEIREKLLELIPRQYHELRHLEEELYRLKLEREKLLERKTACL